MPSIAKLSNEDSGSHSDQDLVVNSLSVVRRLYCAVGVLSSQMLEVRTGDLSPSRIIFCFLAVFAILCALRATSMLVLVAQGDYLRHKMLPFIEYF